MWAKSLGGLVALLSSLSILSQRMALVVVASYLETLGVDFKGLRWEYGENLIWSGCEVRGQPSAWMAFRFCIFLCSNIFDICTFACSI